MKKYIVSLASACIASTVFAVPAPFSASTSATDKNNLAVGEEYLIKMWDEAKKECSKKQFAIKVTDISEAQDTYTITMLLNNSRQWVMKDDICGAQRAGTMKKEETKK